VHSFYLEIILYFWDRKYSLTKYIKMKILVCISHVPDTTSKINFVNGDSEFDTNGVQFVINPNDEFGLTRAIWFKEQQGANVTVVNVGGADAEATLRKALAIGADEAIRINANPTDGMFVAKQLAEVVKNGGYDLVIAGKESLDYNGGMVPGMVAGLLGFNFVNACVGIDVNGNEAKVTREIDGGKETISAGLPLIIGGQKGLVEEKDLRIPNMRGIMMARTKALTLVEPTGDTTATKAVKFEKPAAKSAVKFVNADNLDELINLLHNEAKVI
jgi:electron transfer flavoprotein beta subunit